MRYGLEILFGPSVLHLTNDQTVIFVDSPPNIVSSALMILCRWNLTIEFGDIPGGQEGCLPSFVLVPFLATTCAFCPSSFPTAKWMMHLLLRAIAGRLLPHGLRRHCLEAAHLLLL